MFGCRAGKALAAFWFLPLGIALAGAAGMLFAMSNQNNESDEDEEKTEEANETQDSPSETDEQDPEPSEAPIEVPESEPEAVEPEAVEQEEQSDQQEEEQPAEQAASETGTIVFAAANGKVWHADRDCPTLSRAKKVKELTMSEAEEAGMKACGTCGK